MEDKSSPSSLPLSVAGNSAKLDEKRNSKAEVKAQKVDTGNQFIVEQQGLCEEQVQNAVKFLLHPSVRGSSTVHRVSFLEKKGLSKEEIEEAFHRVSDSSSNDFSGAVAAVEGLPFIQKEQNTTALISSTDAISTQKPMTQQLVPAVSLPVAQAHSGPWGQRALALSFVVAAGTGAGIFFKSFLPQKLKLWVRRIFLVDDAPGFFFQKNKGPAEEVALAAAAAAAAKAASSAAVVVAYASQEMTKMHNKERHYLSSAMQALEAHTLELTNALIAMKVALETVDKSRQLVSISTQLNGSLPPMKEETVMEGIQSTEKLSNPVMTLNGAHGYSGTSASKEDTALQLLQAPLSGKLDGAPHSASYLKIMEMLGQGQTPPGIQEVDDKPPNPYQPPSVSQLQPRPKPWETIRPESGNSPSKVTTYNSRSHMESTIKSTTGNWRQEDEASLMQEIYTSSVSSDAGRGTANTAPWWRQKKESDPHYFSKMEVVADSNGTGLRIPFRSGSESEGNFNGPSVDSQMNHPSWGPHPIPHTAMPAATNYQNMEAKKETRPLSIVQVTPEISQFTDVEGPLSPVGSYAEQNFPSVDQKCAAIDSAVSPT